MGVRDDDGIKLAGVERETAIRAQGVHAIRIEKPTVEQDFMLADLQEVGAARDLPRGAVERDSQTTILPSRGLIVTA